MAESSSFLNAVADRILEGAKLMEDNIDADTLVNRIVSESSIKSRGSKSALSDLKYLSRRAPNAVVATNGAVPALLRVVSQCVPSSGSDNPGDDEDEFAEPLQDALESLCCLIGDGKSKDAKEEEVVSRQSADVAELVIRHTENGKQLLRLLKLQDSSTQIDTLVLLQRVFRILPEPMGMAFLEFQGALDPIMRNLEPENCPLEPVRNECLSLLLLITEADPTAQVWWRRVLVETLTVQGLVETIFRILEEEDLEMGGKVACDLLRCLLNLLSNGTCQRHVCATDGALLFVKAMNVAIGQKEVAEISEVDRGFVEEDRIDVPDEVRWRCWGLLVDAALALASDSIPTSDDPAVVRAALADNAMRQEQVVRAGALDLCRNLLDARMSIPAKLRLVELLSRLGESKEAARVLEREDPQRGPVLSVLVSVLVNPSTALPLRAALGHVLCRIVSRHDSLQRCILCSLSPSIEVSEEGQSPPVGRQIIVVLEDAAANNAEPQPQCLWFSLHLLLAMIHDNPEVQSVSASSPVAIPSDAGPPETLLDLMMRVFSASSKVCRGQASSSGAFGERSVQVSDAADPEVPATGLLAVLKFFVYWLAVCPAVLDTFSRSPVTIPLTMELTTIANACGGFFKIQLEGLACLLMGICIKGQKTGDVQADLDAASLMSMVAKHVGVEGYQQRGDRLWRSEPLQRLPKELSAFRWYNDRFRDFVKEQQRAIQRRMVQLYVTGSVSSGSLSEDVADQYKQLIRVQDDDLQEVKRENEGLRKEVETFMARSLQATSMALAEKVEAMEIENKALHAEVTELTDEVADQKNRFEAESRRMRSQMRDLEQQLQCVVVAYDQVERQSQTLAHENAVLRQESAIVRTGTNGTAQAESDKEVARLRVQVDELQQERTDLFTMLGQIVAACPEATKFVAPLGTAT